MPPKCADLERAFRDTFTNLPTNRKQTKPNLFLPDQPHHAGAVPFAYRPAQRPHALFPMSSILVIEDDDLVRRVVVTALQKSGYQVIDAPNGRAGLKIIRAQRLDLVITDVVMPEQDGLEVMMVMKREFPATPLIAISGAVQNAPLYLGFASKLGATHVLAKPFTLPDLFTMVETALAPSVVPPAKAAPPPPA